jgi:flagellar secretion chaperone FliS
MQNRSDAIHTYGRVANAEADPLQQIVMLYDGAIKFLRLASSSIESREIAAKAEQTDRALQIINYLQSILDLERGADVAASLNALYTSVTLVILNASARLDAKEMRRAADLLSPVRDAWSINARQASVAAQSTSHAPVRAAQAQRIALTF